ncbi:MAG: hypothetical protein Q4G09_05750 [Clostridia bacterium]|nr:hypothetical protein [Clostridia bacterium]
MDKNLEVLKEVCKGVKMGMDAISYVSDKTEDENFKNVLNHEYSMYNNILDKVDDAYSNYGEIPGDSSIKDKAMLWYGIQINTIKDTTSSKLAELLVQGTNMGIIEGRRLLNHNEDLDTDVDKLLNDFVNFQEETVEKLKQYL